MNMLCTILVSLLLLCACTSTKSSALDAQGGIPFKNLARGYQTGVRDSGVRIARNADEWREMWKQHASTVIPLPSAPDVDFEHDMVVLVTLGQRPTYGYGVEIVRIAPVDDQHFRVETVERKPAPDAITSQIVSTPYHMVVTAARAGKAELVER